MRLGAAALMRHCPEPPPCNAGLAWPAEPMISVKPQLGERLTRDARGLDLVTGAGGSPLRLVLSSIYTSIFRPGTGRSKRLTGGVNTLWSKP